MFRPVSYSKPFSYFVPKWHRQGSTGSGTVGSEADRVRENYIVYRNLIFNAQATEVGCFTSTSWICFEGEKFLLNTESAVVLVNNGTILTFTL
jgi:hypothetical protein